MDNEVSGSGNSYDYGFRIYNPRLGRFLSVDPLTSNFPWWTPYQFAGNMPIKAIDLDGKEMYIPEAIPLEPILTIPRVAPIPPVTAPIPPIVGPVPEGITIGQPNVDAMEIPKEVDWEVPPSGPEDLDEEWEEITHPDNKSGGRDFKNKRTGREIHYHPKKEGKPGWEGINHWHRKNPNSTGKRDYYLDKDGNPVPKGSNASHIEAPTMIIIPEVEVTPPPDNRNWFERKWDGLKEWYYNDLRKREIKHYEESTGRPYMT